MEKRVKLDLSGINLVRPSVFGPSTSTTNITATTSDTTTVDVKPDDAAPPTIINLPPTTTRISPLQKAILNKNKSFQERLATLPPPQTDASKMDPEEFARAVMRGMGWREGEGVRGGPAESVELRRVDPGGGGGLGFVSRETAREGKAGQERR
jgi:hypothetical protein